MESLNYIFTKISMVFRLYVKISKSQVSCSALALHFKSLLEHRYREYDNQSSITLECDKAHWSTSGIQPKPQGEPPVNIANKSIHLLEGIINMRPTTKGTLNESTLTSR